MNDPGLHSRSLEGRQEHWNEKLCEVEVTCREGEPRMADMDISERTKNISSKLKIVALGCNLLHGRIHDPARTTSVFESPGRKVGKAYALLNKMCNWLSLLKAMFSKRV
jgi:hypothetical protein